jgi:hypothetical protein
MGPVLYHYGRFPPAAALDWPRLIPLIGPAAAAVARYDGILSAIPNPALLLSPLTTQEAVLSSRIEGTQATMGECSSSKLEGNARCRLSAETTFKKF